MAVARTEETRRDAHLIDFGERVRVLRTQRHLSQEELAHRAGMHRTVIGFVERGEREIGISKLWPLAEALDTQIAELFD